MMAFLSGLFSRAEPALSEAGARDAAAIATLHAASFRRGWSEDEVESLLLQRNVLTHRAMSGPTMAGFIMSRIAADEAEILSVAAARAWRGRGVGHRLLALHLRRLAGAGVRSVFLEVGETNDPATALYLRSGFEEVSRRANYYDDGSGRTTNALVLRRDLF
jgi:[ribosomal protein S18]-alanine N-acetyltransferase